MWARVIEILLGLWLTLSPFIFGHYPSNPALWTNDLICGAAIILLAILSFWSWPVFGFMRYAHLGILGVGGWLTLFGYVGSGHPAAAGYQNNILLGLTLLVMAIIPNQANLPPPSWRHHVAQQDVSQRMHYL
jgi:hypothetical protein